MIFKYAYILPILLSIWFPVTFIITYSIAVHNNDVRAVFPYISDTGNWSPESCFFGLMLNTGAILWGFIVYIRYRQIEEVVRINNLEARINKYSFIGLILGELSAFGIIIVGNFQETNLLVMHLLGAGAAFGGGLIYQCIETYISWQIYPKFGYKQVNIARIVCCGICFLTYAVTTITGALALLQYKGEFKNITKWKKEDGGYGFHLASTINEWLLSLTTAFFTLLFTKEFRIISMSEPPITLNL